MTRLPTGGTTILLLAVVLTGGGLSLAGQQSPGRKRALIIAIGDYPAESGYPRIHVAVDVELVRAALLAQGFDSTGIRVLRDRAATREGILETLAELTAAAGPGDAIVLHYSGHGHRISDDGEDELDGLDELLVPYGAPAALRRGDYHGERHIRDDELGRILTGLRARVGRAGSVTVFLDACYSGSGTRGPEAPAVRGLAEPIIVAGRRPVGRPDSDEGGGFYSGAAVDRGPQADRVPDELGSLVVISASRHDQVAQETHDEAGRPVGSLSLALSRALPRAEPGATYRTLFDRIGVAMAGMDLGAQRPQLEGNADALLFSGQVVAREPFLRVADQLSDSVVLLAGGSVLGLLPGTAVVFLPPGSLSAGAAPPIATGVVVLASPSHASVRVTPAGTAGLTETWAFVTEYAFGDLRLRIQVDPTLRPALRAIVRRVIGSLEILQSGDSAPDLRLRRVGPASGPERIALNTADGRTRLGPTLDPANPTFAERLRAALLSRARASYLRRLELSAPEIEVGMELITTEPRIDWTTDPPTCAARDPVPRGSPAVAGGELTLAPRDEYTLRLSNTGSEPVYLVVLDIQSDDHISQIFPVPEDEGSDNLLPPGRSYLIRDACFFADEPLGVELLKLFATRERVDFATALSGEVERSRLDPLARLVSDATAGRGGALRGAPGAGATYGITLTVTSPGGRQAGKRP